MSYAFFSDSNEIDRSKEKYVNKVLVIGMADSIHIARWLKQFHSSEAEIHFFPSAKFRQFTAEFKILGNTNKIKILSKTAFGTSAVSGYFDYFLYEFGGKIFQRNLRSIRLSRLIQKNRYSLIHAIEIQHAGYLLLETTQALTKKSKIMLTNWGSDLYFFAENQDHAERISSLLKLTDYYSAECNRDYVIASELGYSGSFLPVIPNAGGFQLDKQHLSRASDRTLILIKANGGTFGNVTMLFPLIVDVLTQYPDISVHFYSVTADVQDRVSEVSELFPDKVSYSTVNNRLSHKQMLDLFEKARIYLSSSKSDGISTSFLEALVSGAYPIQSNTSCAAEWVKKGFMASVIPNNEEDYRSALRQALSSDEFVDLAQITNSKLAPQHLDENVIRETASNFYDSDYLDALPNRTVLDNGCK